MIIENTGDIKTTDNLVMIVYGKGGVGKTTFAASSPSPLILDFENGTKYLGERGFQCDVVRMAHWLTGADKTDLRQMLKTHETIVLDPLGEAMEKLIDSDEIKGAKFRTSDGGLTMAGWGEVKKQMRSFIKFLRDTGKNVIIVSHVAEIATDQGLEHRIQVATKLSDEIPNMVDVISYLGIQKRDNGISRILYTPTQGGSFDSKDRTGRIPPTVEIGETTGWADLMSSMAPLTLKDSPVTQSNLSTGEPERQPDLVPTGDVQDGNEPMTSTQKARLIELSTQMTGYASQYLVKSAEANLTWAQAQNVIERAEASLKGAR